MNKDLLQNTSVAYPNGKQFLQLFSKEANIKVLPYMNGASLDVDTVLYKALLIILANRLGLLEARLNEANDDDTVDSDSRQQLTSDLVDAYDKTAQFMSSQAMIALRDNEYHTDHENQSRLACYEFLEK